MFSSCFGFHIHIENSDVALHIAMFPYSSENDNRYHVTTIEVFMSHEEK